MDNEIYVENDKILCPYLLAASFSGLLTYLGSHKDNGVIYWKFSPKKDAKELIEAYYTKREPHIHARDLFEAISTFWQQVRYGE